MAKMNVKKGDNVMVIAGKDKGNAGKVLKVLPEENRVYVEGINIVSKSKKPRNAQDKGGILKQEAAIDASNVMHLHLFSHCCRQRLQSCMVVCQLRAEVGR